MKSGKRTTKIVRGIAIVTIIAINTSPLLASFDSFEIETQAQTQFQGGFSKPAIVLDASTIQKLSGDQIQTSEQTNNSSEGSQKEETKDVDQSFSGILLDAGEALEQDEYIEVYEEDVERRTVKPVSSGFVEVKLSKKSKIQNNAGIRELVTLVNKLLGGMGASSIISFAATTEGSNRWDGISAEEFQFDSSANLLDSIKSKLLGV